MNRARPHRLLGTAGAATIVLVAVALLTGAAIGSTPPDGEPPLGPALSEQDRRDLEATPVLRGTAAAPPGLQVDPADPEAVARAYLQAARAVSAADAGRSNLRAARYAEPGSPAAEVGVLVLDPPPAGAVRTATVRALVQVAADRADSRRGYLAATEIATGPPAGPVAVELLTSHIVLARQPDGQWLVTVDAPESPDLPAGED